MPDYTATADCEVRRVQPYEATKAYLCPGCNRDIAPGTGHVVAVPRDAPDLRRHWHHGCWAARTPTRAAALSRSTAASERTLDHLDPATDDAGDVEAHLVRTERRRLAQPPRAESAQAMLLGRHRPPRTATRTAATSAS